MSDFLTWRLRCPVCNVEFASEVEAPGHFEGRESDFRPVFEGPDPLPATIHTCPSCRFTAYLTAYEVQEKETEDEDRDELLFPEELGDREPPPFPQLDEEEVEGLRRWIRQGQLLHDFNFDGREPSGAERFILGARCYEHLRDGDPVGASDFWLRASWCARGAGDGEVEHRCQREALERLISGLQRGQVADPDKARATYLAAELSRRSGDFARAVDLFGQVEGLTDTDEPEGKLLADLARRQQLLAVVQSAVNARIREEDFGPLKKEVEWDDDDPYGSDE